MSGAAPPSPDLVGRQAELEAVRRALKEAAAGRPSVVLVTGEAGVGKTSLVRAAVQGAGSVALGRCIPLIGPSIPYAPWTQALRTLGSSEEGQGLAHILAGGRGGAAPRTDASRE